MTSTFGFASNPNPIMLAAMSGSSPDLPAREIPGDYGLPFFGPIKDRLSYYYGHGGEVQFFKSRIQRYQSTVFRCNMPPGPIIARDSRVVCLLDAVSFQVLFDNTRVEKRDVLDGTFMPSTAFTGGYRVCAYLDPSEPNHAVLKNFFLSQLSRRHERFIPLFRQAAAGLFSALEDDLAAKGEAGFNELSDTMSFDFVFRLFCDRSPTEMEKLGHRGPRMVDTWLLCQLAPLMTLGLKFVPDVLEDLLLHTFPLPFFLVKSNYTKLYDAFYESAGSMLDEAERLGLGREEACHNLVFLAGFNAYGGMKRLFPSLVKWISTAGGGLHRRLREEIRAAVKGKSGVTLEAVSEMALTKSVVYEVLRIEPPVPYQYGHAKADFEIRSHESTFRIKKGEMLFGYQPIATKDPRVFSNPEEFVADRFVGEAGEDLLRYVYWSNGLETEAPTAANKQCPGKELVVLLCRLLVVELFLRYDTFEAEGSPVKFKSLTQAHTHVATAAT